MIRHRFPVISGNQADKGKLWIPIVLKKKKNVLMKDAIKGVFPSLGPKALKRTWDTWSLFLSFLSFVFFFLLPFEKWGRPGEVKSICVVTMNSERKVLWLCFSRQPSLLIVHRGLNESKHEQFLGKHPNNWSYVWNRREGVTEMNTADCTSKATNLFLCKEKLS